MIDTHQLPALPIGWYYENHAFDQNVVHVVIAEHGAAESINFKTRTTESGWCVPQDCRFAHKPIGRKWKERLVLAAVDKMKVIWD